ncbi:MAG: DNA mismatch repair endonuclease MutL [Phycisphaerales bacterium]
MALINRLPPLLVNQIAAGEVVERPASVVKELVENSIDAGASRIGVSIEQGGRELIEVTDDGSGIAEDDLPLALAPHATSKIREASDLDAIATLGFRGEALASIMSVSRMSITSRLRDAVGALRIEAEGDEAGAPRPCAGPPGTTVTVRNLFFNTPARRKFLRAETTEFNHIRDLVERQALSHPAIGFTLTHNGRVAIELPPDQQPIERILAVLGRELADELLEVSVDDAVRGRPMSLWGLVGSPAIAKGAAKSQVLFLNGRPVREKTILHAVKEAYRGLIEPTRFPVVVLYLEMDPSQVDVNVHPAKSEVRFRDSQSVHGFVLTSVRDRLRLADLTPSVGDTLGASPGASLLSAAGEPGAVNGTGGPDAFVEYFKRMEPDQKTLVYRQVREAMGGESVEDASDDSLRESEVPPEITVRPVSRLLQVHNSYIILENDEGIEIVDQHALHERVMFEELKRRILTGSLESQRLLMPAVVDASPAQMTLLDELRPLLERIGIEAEPMGPRSIAIHGFPSFLFERGVEPADFVIELFERAEEERLAPDDEAALSEVLDMMSCKAAVKAGDRLTESEIESLLNRKTEIERGSNCPHGRPTTIRLSLRDLEKHFGRR